MTTMKRKALALITTTALLFSGVCSGGFLPSEISMTNKVSAAEALPGDVTLDGQIDITDLSLLMIRIVDKNELTGQAKINGDVDNDGLVTLSDLAKLRQYVSKIIETFREATSADTSPLTEPSPSNPPENTSEKTEEQYAANSFIITLYPEYAPITCSNFEELVEDGFYDGVTFHRVVDNFMAQGGDPTGTGEGGSSKKIKGEFASNGITNPLSHERGVVSMARNSIPDSASSQFFICYTDCTFLDGSYAAFGKVTDGMEIIDSFLKVPRSLNEIKEIAYPDNKIIIEKATMISPDEDNHPRVLMTMNDFLK